MKLLILTCSTGGGHNTAALALREAAIAQGHEAEVLDFMLLRSKQASEVVSNAYIEMAKNTPKLFGMVYRLGRLVSTSRHKSPLYMANIRLAKDLERYLNDNGFDAVAATHLYPAEALTYLKRHNRLKQRSAAVATDYTCIPFWEDLETDVIITAHEALVDEAVRRGLAREKLYPLGIPVSAAFAHGLSKQEARTQLGLSDRDTYLIMGGSMGFKAVETLAKAVFDKMAAQEQAVIICGSNVKLKKHIIALSGDRSNVRVVGFTNKVAVYMAASDVLFTKPGGLTSTEALVAGIPMVHTDPIPGCETKNRSLFVRLGLSVTAPGASEQAVRGRLLMHDLPAREQMLAHQRSNAKPDAAAAIVRLLTEEA